MDDNGTRRRRHPADVARRGRGGRGLQAPGAQGSAAPGRDHRQDEVRSARAGRRACSSKFTSVAGEQSMLVADTDDYVKRVLRKALGDDKANLLIDRILQGSDVSGIESLKWMDAGAVAELLRNEHPQIVAAILVHLDSDQAGAVLKRFPERQRNEVLVRIATLDGIQPSGAEGPERGDEQGAGRRRQAAQGVARRRQDGGRDHQPAGRERSRPRCSTTSARPTTTWRRRSWTTCSPSTTWTSSTTRASRRC